MADRQDVFTIGAEGTAADVAGVSTELDHFGFVERDRPDSGRVVRARRWPSSVPSGLIATSRIASAWPIYAAVSRLPVNGSADWTVFGTLSGAPQPRKTRPFAGLIAAASAPIGEYAGRFSRVRLFNGDELIPSRLRIREEEPAGECVKCPRAHLETGLFDFGVLPLHISASRR